MKPADRAIARLMAVYGQPKTDDPDLFVIEFRKALEGWSEHALSGAVDRWMKRDTAFWPRPGELLAEAERVPMPQREFTKHELAEHMPFVDEPGPTPEMRARVTKLVEDFRRDMASRALAAMSSRAATRHTLTDRSRHMTGERDE